MKREIKDMKTFEENFEELRKFCEENNRLPHHTAEKGSRERQLYNFLMTYNKSNKQVGELYIKYGGKCKNKKGNIEFLRRFCELKGRTPRKTSEDAEEKRAYGILCSKRKCPEVREIVKIYGNPNWSYERKLEELNRFVTTYNRLPNSDDLPDGSRLQHFVEDYRKKGDKEVIRIWDLYCFNGQTWFEQRIKELIEFIYTEHMWPTWKYSTAPKYLKDFANIDKSKKNYEAVKKIHDEFIWSGTAKERVLWGVGFMVSDEELLELLKEYQEQVGSPNTNSKDEFGRKLCSRVRASKNEAVVSLYKAGVRKRDSSESADKRAKRLVKEIKTSGKLPKPGSKDYIFILSNNHMNLYKKLRDVVMPLIKITKSRETTMNKVEAFCRITGRLPYSVGNEEYYFAMLRKNPEKQKELETLYAKGNVKDTTEMLNMSTLGEKRVMDLNLVDILNLFGERKVIDLIDGAHILSVDSESDILYAQLVKQYPNVSGNIIKTIIDPLDKETCFTISNARAKDTVELVNYLIGELRYNIVAMYAINNPEFIKRLSIKIDMTNVNFWRRRVSIRDRLAKYAFASSSYYSNVANIEDLLNNIGICDKTN